MIGLSTQSSDQIRNVQLPIDKNTLVKIGLRSIALIWPKWAFRRFVIFSVANLPFRLPIRMYPSTVPIENRVATAGSYSIHIAPNARDIIGFSLRTKSKISVSIGVFSFLASHLKKPFLFKLAEKLWSNYHLQKPSVVAVKNSNPVFDVLHNKL